MRKQPPQIPDLSQAEHQQLTALTFRGKTSQARALRARIVLACSQGLANVVIAARYQVSQQTVAKWRARFLALRLPGLLDATRSGAPRTLDDDRVHAVIAKTLHSAPITGTRWTTRTMASEAGLSQSAVSRIWRAFGLQPKRRKT